MITYAITGILLVEAIALLSFLAAMRRAQEGWQDESGFHPGEAEPANARVSTAVEPPAPQQSQVEEYDFAVR